MTEERLQEIKDSIEFQALYIKEHNFETALLEEETDLYNEVITLIEENERLKKELNKHIKEGIEKDIIIDKAINILELSAMNKGICTQIETDTIQSTLLVLKGSDKE